MDGLHDVLQEKSDSNSNKNLEAKEVRGMGGHVRPVKQTASKSDKGRTEDDERLVSAKLGDDPTGDDDENGLDHDHCCRTKGEEGTQFGFDEAYLHGFNTYREAPFRPWWHCLP